MNRAAAALFLLVAAATALSLGASALSVTVSFPTDGVWTSADSAPIAGTAAGPTPDQRLLTADGDFAPGTGINTTITAGSVVHAPPAHDHFHYEQSFTGLAGAAVIDPYWSWNLTGSSWAVSNGASFSATPPSLVRSAPGNDSFAFRALMFGPMNSASVTFDYYCEANASLNVFASHNGRASAEVSILSSFATPSQTTFSYNLSTQMLGKDAVFVRFQVEGLASPGEACAIDDFSLDANATRSAARAARFSENFTEASISAAFFTAQGGWGISSSPSVSDTPGALAHNQQAVSSIRANFAYPTPIRSANVYFHYQCEANATISAFVSADGINETNLVASPIGAPHAVVNFNATSKLSGQLAAHIRFTSNGLLPADMACGIDDLWINATIDGHLNQTYTGTYSTEIVDLGVEADLASVAYGATVPVNTTASAYFRSSSNNLTFSAWQQVPAGGGAPSQSTGRYVQWRADFTSITGLFAAGLDYALVNFSAITQVEWSIDGSPYYAANGTTSWNAVVPLASGANTITIRARDTTGATSTDTVVILRDTFPPGVAGRPATVAVTNLSSLTWTWTAANDVGLGVSHYLIDIGLSPGGTQLGSDIRVDNTTYTATGLPDGVTVYAQVRAVDNAGLVGANSPSSNGALVDQSSPGGATVVSPGQWSANASLTWSWTPAYDVGSGVADYSVWIGTTPGGSDVFAQRLNATSYTLAAATSGTTYYLSVAAHDAAGNMGSWVTSTATTVDLDAPQGPSSITAPPAFSNATTLTWSWAAAVDPVSGVDHYIVSVGTTSGGFDIAQGDVVGLSYNLVFADSGPQYFFQVAAVDRAGNVGPLQFAPPSRVDSIPPAAVSIDSVGGFIGNASIVVKWSEATDAPAGGPGVHHYHVTVAEGGVLTVQDPVDPQITIDVADGRNYTVTIAAVDAAGNLGQEVSVSFRGDLVGPTAPTDLAVRVANPAGPTFIASWNASTDSGSGLREYRVHIGTSPGASDFASNVRVIGFNHTWTGTIGTRYYVTVWAVDNLGHRGAEATDSQGVVAQKQGGSPGFEAVGALAAALLAAGVVSARRRLRG